MLLTILFYSFLFVVGVQLIYYILIYPSFAFAKVKMVESSTLPISIVIAARNEAEHLQENLTAILNQHYSDFEVIVVNDASTDHSTEILKKLQETYQQLHILNLSITDSYNGNKKNAISKGIEMARYDHLLFTDADCKPVSAQWISTMANHFKGDISIVLGYGAYQKTANSFLNKIIRYETLLTAIQYFSYAKIGIPYMGVGRNLAYKKELFIKNKGFETHKHLKSGDDDLFINDIANATNLELCFYEKSFTKSQPKKDFRSWFRQKRRHISTATRYKLKHQFLLGIFFLSQLLFWCFAIILLIFMYNWQIVTILIAIRLISQYTIAYNAAKKLNEKDIVWYTPILDFILVMVQFALFCSNSIAKPKHW